MNDRIIVINCHGTFEEIVTSLKEVVEKFDEILQKHPQEKLTEGTRFESNSKNVVSTVLK